MQSSYFQSHMQYFWQWEDDGGVVAIPNGHTIAYREQVIEIMQMLINQGLPPFGTLLLTILATNSRGKEAIKTIVPILEQTSIDYDRSQVNKAIEFLDRLSELPENYKTGPDRKKLLLSLFLNGHNIYAVKKSRKFFKTFQGRRGLALNNLTVRPFTRSVIARDFKILSLLADRFLDTDSIIKNISGLPEFPEDIMEIEPIKKESKKPDDFIEELMEHETTFPVASLVKRIWSGLRIPFHNNVPSQQPLGGIADLTNKGEFDKLLLSEFANDDLVFLSRLANNEALYFHREIPPADHQLERVILIDVSLKNWGRIRTIAFATMLAIAHHPKTEIACEVYVVGDHPYRVKVDTLDQIIKALEVLSGTLDASRGLKQFFEKQDLSNKEVFLISNEESLTYPNLRKVMFDHFAAIDYWIHPTLEGKLDLYKRQQSSKKYIHSIHLPLEELWQRKDRPKPVKSEVQTTFQKSYPILFDVPIGVKKNLISEDGYIYKITKEKALMKSFQKQENHHKSGWELICEKLPHAHGDFALGKNPKGELILLMYSMETKQITLFNTTDQSKVTLNFPHWYYSVELKFCFLDNAFYFSSYRVVWKISLRGELSKMTEGLDRVATKIKAQNLALKGVNSSTSTHRQVFKNTSSLSINGLGELVFNIHRLHISAQNIAMLIRDDSTVQSAKAKRITNELYEFSEGSRVHINRVGMFTLESSNPDIPKIYIPSILNRSLGLMAGNDFAGNAYYKKNRKCNLKVKQMEGKYIQVIKLAKIRTGLGLRAVREVIENSNSTFNNLEENIALALQKDLKNIGVDSELHSNRLTDRRLDVQTFNKQYIKPFINNILKDAAPD